VKQFKIKANEQQKRAFLNRFYGELGATQAMIFVNAKKTAEFL
jgi:superfamily II DNA/RNA helicase